MSDERRRRWHPGVPGRTPGYWTYDNGPVTSNRNPRAPQTISPEENSRAVEEYYTNGGGHALPPTSTPGLRIPIQFGGAAAATESLTDLTRMEAIIGEMFSGGGGGGGDGGAAAAAAARDAAARKRIEEMYASMLSSLNRNVDVAGSQIGTASADLVRALTAIRDRTQQENRMAQQQMAGMYQAQTAQSRQMFNQGLAEITRRGGDPTDYLAMRGEMMGGLGSEAARWNALTRSNGQVINGQMQGQLASGRTMGTGAQQQLANARVSAAAALDRQRLQALAQYGG